MENQYQVNFRLEGIKTEQFAIIEGAFDKSIEQTELTYGLRFGYNLEQRIISTMVSVRFSQDKGPFLILEVGCYFEIIKEHWERLYNQEQAQINLPLSVATHLTVIAMGTLRGVLHCKVESTPLNMFVLPTINVKELIKDDVILSTNQSSDS